MSHKPLTREYLLKQGSCCDGDCMNCPYIDIKYNGRRKDQIEFSNKMAMISIGSIIGIVIFLLITSLIF
jgi:hypothetical protein